jgi:MOSC domain-containing protein YiiM
VYSYAREDLDWWQGEIGEALRSGMFGENLTTFGIDLTGARIGERWQVGRELVLQVTAPRIPCATFATWMRRQGWMRTFTRRAHPGAYLRVLEPGEVRRGDSLVVLDRPDHEVTVGVVFRALTLERSLLASLLPAADYLEVGTLRRAEEYARGDGNGS